LRLDVPLLADGADQRHDELHPAIQVVRREPIGPTKRHEIDIHRHADGLRASEDQRLPLAGPLAAAGRDRTVAAVSCQVRGSDSGEALVLFSCLLIVHAKATGAGHVSVTGLAVG